MTLAQREAAARILAQLAPMPAKDQIAALALVCKALAVCHERRDRKDDTLTTTEATP